MLAVVALLVTAKAYWKCKVCRFENREISQRCSECYFPKNHAVDDKWTKDSQFNGRYWEKKKSCPHCTFNNKLGAKRCEICDKPFPGPKKAPVKAFRTCPHCQYFNSLNATGNTNCTNCGGELNQLLPKDYDIMVMKGHELEARMKKQPEALKSKLTVPKPAPKSV